MAGIILAAAVLGGGAGTYVLLAHPFSHSQSPTASGSNAANSSALPAGAQPSGAPAGSQAAASPTTTASAVTPATATASASATQAVTERQAATQLSGLLSQSSSDRSAINQAYNDVSGCGSLLGQDQQTFQQAAASRRSLIGQLASLSGASTLPAALLSDLTGAWQASEQVDQDYAQWAGDENANGCTQQDYTDPGYTAAESPNTRATADKTSFVSLWDPVAQKYGLPLLRPEPDLAQRPV